MRFNIHAGHGAKGRGAVGAVGLIEESVENRIVRDKVIAILRANGHTAYDCTVDTGNKNTILSDIVKKCNANKVDLDVSIHFNSAGNQSANGEEVFVYNNSSSAYASAKRVSDNLAKLGFSNRGVKTSTSLYYLKKCKNPCMLIEVCFVSSPKDVDIYRKKLNEVAQAIAIGITNGLVNTSTMYDGVDYSKVFDADYYANAYFDLRSAFGHNHAQLFNHFVVYGMKEGRKASPNFDVRTYRSNYADLEKAFGGDFPSYYKHYCVFGYKEGRKAI